jgi:hypothetical protein
MEGPRLGAYEVTGYPVYLPFLRSSAGRFKAEAPCCLKSSVALYPKPVCLSSAMACFTGRRLSAYKFAGSKMRSDGLDIAPRAPL